MTSVVGKVRVITKGGKTKLERKRGYTSKRAHLKAARLEKAWKGKRK